PGPSASFENTRDSLLTIPEPGGGLGTPITTLTLAGPASYVIEFSGFVKRNGLSAGQGAVHAIQLRRDGTLIMATRAGTDLTTGGEASTPVSITRLVNITAPSQVID